MQAESEIGGGERGRVCVGAQPDRARRDRASGRAASWAATASRRGPAPVRRSSRPGKVGRAARCASQRGSASSSTSKASSADQPLGATTTTGRVPRRSSRGRRRGAPPPRARRWPAARTGARADRAARWRRGPSGRERIAHRAGDTEMRRGAAAELPLGHRHQPDRRMAGAEAQREQRVAEVVPVDDHARPAPLRRAHRHRQRRQHRRRLREDHRRVGFVEGGGERPSLRGGAAGGAGEIARPGGRARHRRIGKRRRRIAGWSHTAAHGSLPARPIRSTRAPAPASARA